MHSAQLECGEWQYGSMPGRKLTFTLPQDLAVEFLRRVPASLRSQYVATAIADKLREREAQLVQACEAANLTTPQMFAKSRARSMLWQMNPRLCRNDGRSPAGRNLVGPSGPTLGRVIIPLSTSPQPSAPLLVPVQCDGRENYSCKILT